MSEVLLTAEERHQLVAVLRELDPGSPREHRSGVRRKVLMNLWIRRLVKGKSRMLQKVVLLDVSKKGLAMLSPTAFGHGDKLVVPLEFGEGGGWLVLCEVRNCRKLPNGRYKIGAQFIDRIEDTDGKSRIPGDWLAYAR